MSFTEQMRAEIMEDFRRVDIPAILGGAYTAPLPDGRVVVRLDRAVIGRKDGCGKHGTELVYANGRCRICQRAAAKRWRAK